MVAVFDILRVNANPAKFDAKKCEAINAAHIRRLSTDELADQLVPFLVAADLVADPPTPEQWSLLVGATPLIQERMTTLSEGVELIGFLFIADADVEIDEAADAAGHRRAGAGRGGRGAAHGGAVRPRGRSRQPCGRL